jgi:hypothetical protein
MNPIGFSTGCCPELTGPEIAALAVRLGVDVLDIRAGKGQAWESDGLAPLADAGLRVAFAGVSVVLGRPAAPVDQCLSLLDSVGASAVPVKVFADAGVGRDADADALARSQIAQILAARGPAGLLIETHHGYADLVSLVELCADTDALLLLDTFGLARLGTALVDAEPLLSGQVAACQVKGFTDAGPQARHVALAQMPGEHGQQLRAIVPPGSPILVESRSGTLEADLRTIRDWFPVSR